MYDKIIHSKEILKDNLTKRTTIKEIIKQFRTIEETLRKELIKTDLRISFNEYKAKTIFIGLIIGLSINGLLLLIDASVFVSVILSGVIFFCVIFSGFILPFKLNELKAKKIEAGMPFLLLELSILLKLNVLPEKALEKITKRKELFAVELRKALNEKRKGKNLRSALKKMTEKINSTELKSFSSMILSIIDENPKEKENTVKMLALNLIEKQKNELKAYANKTVMYSLLFIVFAALIPAFLLAFIVIGSLFLELKIKEFDVFLLLTIIFPLIDSSLLALIYFKLPETIKEGAK